MPNAAYYRLLSINQAVNTFQRIRPCSSHGNGDCILKDQKYRDEVLVFEQRTSSCLEPKTSSNLFR